MTADCAARSNAGERCHDGAGSDERAESWNREGADAHQPSQTAAQHRAGASAGCCAFWSLGVLLVSKVPGPAVLWEQHGNIGVAKVCRLQSVDGIVDRRDVGIDAKYGCVFTCHCVSPLCVQVLLLRRDVQLVGYMALAGHFSRLLLNHFFLGFRTHGPLQSNLAVLGNDLDVLRVGR